MNRFVLLVAYVVALIQLFVGAIDVDGQTNLQSEYSFHPADNSLPTNLIPPSSHSLNPMNVNPQHAPYQNPQTRGWQHANAPNSFPNPGPYPHSFDPTMIPVEQAGSFDNQRVDDAAKRAASHVRAGYPLSISKRAIETYNSDYQGYYVGGGVPNGRRRPRGEPRHLDEGTWGMDYAPFFTRVASSWSHGRLFQGGIGQYEPDEKNRPFGQTFGKHFGNKERRFESHHSSSESHTPAAYNPFQHEPRMDADRR